MARRGSAKLAEHSQVTPQLSLRFPHSVTISADISPPLAILRTNIREAVTPEPQAAPSQKPEPVSHSQFIIDTILQQEAAAKIVARMHTALTGSLVAIINRLKDPQVSLLGLTPEEHEIAACIIELHQKELASRIPRDCFILDVFDHGATFEQTCGIITEAHSARTK